MSSEDFKANEAHDRIAFERRITTNFVHCDMVEGKGTTSGPNITGFSNKKSEVNYHGTITPLPPCH